MKLIRKTGAAAAAGTDAARPPPWKLLVVDDEPDVRALTTLSLKDFRFAGRGLQQIEAGSAAEAKLRLAEHPDIAVALVDVVMETDDAGLALVEAIRGEFANAMMRIIIRTGQPGVAPERFVIDHFDIDDYKDKTELTSQKLYTAMRSALKAYRDLQTIELNRRGLASVLDATPGLYELQRETLEAFFEGILTQVIALCKLTHSGLISTIDGVLTTVDGDGLHVRAGAGELHPDTAQPERLAEVIALCARAVADNAVPDGLRAGAMIAPLVLHEKPAGFIYLEASEELNQNDRALIQVMANQCSAALENFRLHIDLRKSYEQAIETLGQVAEFKDSTTGTHIRRMAEYTGLLAQALGVAPAQAVEFGRAALLHDVGKVGIPDAVLQKPGKLTAQEFDVVKQHTHLGGAILSHDPALAMARDVAIGHHERWDGAGYPHGLAGEDIPLVTRIVAVADVFDALVSARPYKDAWAPADAIVEIEANAGIQFDPAVVAALVELYNAGKLDAILDITGASAAS